MKLILFTTILASVWGIATSEIVDAADVSDLTTSVDAEGTMVTITDCDTSAAGSLVIPAAIDGVPVTHISAQAFRSCSELTSIVVPDSVISLGNLAFYRCDKLSSVQLSANLTEIERETFRSCGSLLSLSIPEGVTSIGTYAFLSADSLASISLPSTLQTIGNNAFTRCGKLESIEIPAGVTLLSEELFYNCTSLTEVVLNEGLQSLGKSVFHSCSALSSITLPASVTDMTAYTFSNATGLTNIEVNSSNLNYSSLDGVLFNKLFTELISYPDIKAGEYIIPESVTTLGDLSFYYCTALMNVVIHEGITELPMACLLGCSSLTKLDLPSSLTTINTFAIAQCSALQSIKIPDGVTVIPQYCFSGCSALESIEFPANLDSIDNDAFSNCDALAALELPEGLTAIGSKAFGYCENLHFVTLPTTLTSWDNWTFTGCESLRAVVFLGDAFDAGESSNFYGTASDFTVYYLKGATGFGATYDGEITVEIDTGLRPAALWLLAGGFDYDQDVSADLSGDGVSLLEAFAFDLDPNENLSGSQHTMSIVDGELELEFYAGTRFVSYRVETSTDLTNWTSSGVTNSNRDANSMRKSSIPVSGDQGFVRISLTLLTSDNS